MLSGNYLLKFRKARHQSSKLGILTDLYIHFKLDVRVQLFECCIDEVWEIETTTKWLMVRITIG